MSSRCTDLQVWAKDFHWDVNQTQWLALMDGWLLFSLHREFYINRYIKQVSKIYLLEKIWSKKLDLNLNFYIYLPLWTIYHMIYLYLRSRFFFWKSGTCIQLRYVSKRELERFQFPETRTQPRETVLAGGGGTLESG